MADSKGNVEERLARLEEAVVNIAGILVDQSARIDYGFRVAREENQALKQEMNDLRRDLRQEMGELRSSLTDRLDRLITATLRSGTQTADRLADIELRLAKLEDRERH